MSKKFAKHLKMDAAISDKIRNKSNEAIMKLVPAKSADRYQKEFNLFCAWKNENGVVNVNEEVLLAYMLDLSKKLNSSSLWAKYSMVKSMLLVQENLDISRFPKLIAFLKKNSVGYQPVKSRTLSREEINRFLKEACNQQYLLTKVVTIFGIAGGCRREELHNMSLDDIEDTGRQLVVTIPRTKTNQKRVFTIINEVKDINFLELVKMYIKLRPANLPHKMLFIGYRRGKCISQRVGIHTIGAMPKKIAEFLGLKDPDKYTGHCFRRSSATLLANAGVDLTVLKRHGAWKSSSVAERYIEESIEGKQRIARMIQGGESFVEVLQKEPKEKSTTTFQNIATTSSVNDIEQGEVSATSTSTHMAPINIGGNTNCSITVNIKL